MQDIPLDFSYKGKQMVGIAVPLGRSSEEKPAAYDIIIDKAFLGTLRCNSREWKLDTDQDPQLVEKICGHIQAWYV